MQPSGLTAVSGIEIPRNAMRHTSALALALVAAGPALVGTNDNAAPLVGTSRNSTADRTATGNNRAIADVVNIDSQRDGSMMVAASGDR